MSRANLAFDLSKYCNIFWKLTGHFNVQKNMLGKHILAGSIQHYLVSKENTGEGVGAHMLLKEGSPQTE